MSSKFEIEERWPEIFEKLSPISARHFSVRWSLQAMNDGIPTDETSNI